MLLALQLVAALWFVSLVNSAASVGVLAAAAVVFLLIVILWFGFYMVAPNERKILQLFGKYSGTDHVTGLRWSNPLFKKTSISLKVRNFESGRLKVNDAQGNPIEIAAVVVWRVVDSAEAYFEVDDYESFVTIQSEAALRNLAAR